MLETGPNYPPLEAAVQPKAQGVHSDAHFPHRLESVQMRRRICWTQIKAGGEWNLIVDSALALQKRLITLYRRNAKVRGVCGQTHTSPSVQ
jgi:hypothetical protein